MQWGEWRRYRSGGVGIPSASAEARAGANERTKPGQTRQIRKNKEIGEHGKTTRCCAVLYCAGLPEDDCLSSGRPPTDWAFMCSEAGEGWRFRRMGEKLTQCGSIDVDVVPGVNCWTGQIWTASIDLLLLAWLQSAEWLSGCVAGQREWAGRQAGR